MPIDDALWIPSRLGIFAPQEFTVRGNTPNKVAVQFDEVRGADKYWIYLTPVGAELNGSETIIRETKNSTGSVPGLTPGVTYQVQLKSRITDANGKAFYSEQTDVLGTITTPNWEEVNPVATATEEGVSVSWTAPTGAGAYYVYRSTNGGKSFAKIATISDGATTYVDAKATKGTYVYAIKTQIVNDMISTNSGLMQSNAVVK